MKQTKEMINAPARRALAQFVAAAPAAGRRRAGVFWRARCCCAPLRACPCEGEAVAAAAARTLSVATAVASTIVALDDSAAALIIISTSSQRC